jgi:ATP adenylyltransferase
MKYMQHHENSHSCIFCAALEQEDSPNNLIVHRGKNAFVILNRYPYTSGHLMVVPNAHHPSIDLLDGETRLELMDLFVEATQALKDIYKPHGFNIGANIGPAAGAGVASHIHFHVVPRWDGDTNFMTTLADSRVIPEDLESAFDHLQNWWKKR